LGRVHRCRVWLANREPENNGSIRRPRSVPGTKKQREKAPACHHESMARRRANPRAATRRAFCTAGALLLAGCAGSAPDARTAAIAGLGATGRLRAAINFGNPILASRGASGEPQGVSVDLAREAARRLGLEIELVRFESAGSVVDAVKARQVDLAFVA